MARVVARSGLDAVTFRAVAAEAGVSHGLASYHFPDRETMIEEAFRWTARRAIQTTRMEGLAQSPAQYAADLPQVIAGSPFEAIYQFELEIQGFRRPELRGEVQTQYRGYVEAVQRSLEQWGLGANPAVARLVFAVLDGLALQQLIFDSPEDTAECIKVLQSCLSVAAERARQSGTAQSAPGGDPADQVLECSSAGRSTTLNRSRPALRLPFGSAACGIRAEV